MDAIKSIARRATQTVRSTISEGGKSDEDKAIDDTRAKILQYERVSTVIGMKLDRIGTLYEELGRLLAEVASDYRDAPDKAPEAEDLSRDLQTAGKEIEAKGKEFRKKLKEDAQDPLTMFLKEIPKLREIEEDRHNKHLEYDFFKTKVMELRSKPPKDTSRIPRNEAILESWRVEHWRATETNKAAVSSLYSHGRQTIDRSCLVLAQTTGLYVHGATAIIKKSLFNAKLPVYDQGPKLTPTPLPPNPLPPFQQPAPQYALPGNNWQQPQSWSQPGGQAPPATPPPNWANNPPQQQLPAPPVPAPQQPSTAVVTTSPQQGPQ